jgi:hypothetical protein
MENQKEKIKKADWITLIVGGLVLSFISVFGDFGYIPTILIVVAVTLVTQQILKYFIKE